MMCSDSILLGMQQFLINYTRIIDRRSDAWNELYMLLCSAHKQVIMLKSRQKVKITLDKAMRPCVNIKTLHVIGGDIGQFFNKFDTHKTNTGQPCLKTIYFLDR